MAQKLDDAPPLDVFLANHAASDSAGSWHDIAAGDLGLRDSGLIAVNSKSLQGEFTQGDAALTDLAALAGIPLRFFVERCTDDLRAVLYERLRPTKKRLLVLVHDNVVEHIVKGDILPTPRLEVLEVVRNAAPEAVVRDQLKVIEFSWNGALDVSVISPSLTSEPRPGDTVAHGVSINDMRGGAVQIHHATHRCVCSNGAVARVCDGRVHHIRRPGNGPGKKREFLSKVEAAAVLAWRRFSETADHLKKLQNGAIDPTCRRALLARLRPAPFFLNAGDANLVLDRLPHEIDEHGGVPSLLDLWNAVSFTATHNTELSVIRRLRMRLAAGELVRGESRFCKECRQLVIS